MDNKKNIKVLQIHASDGGGGGAFVAYHLMDKLDENGEGSSLYVGTIKSSLDSRVKYLSRRMNLANKIADAVSLPKKYHRIWAFILRTLAKPAVPLQILTGKERTNGYSTKCELKRILAKEKPDIVHCHNLHSNYFDLSVLPWLSKQVPTIITLHDAWLLTGHCAHFFDCMKWKEGCGNCPSLSTYPRILQDATAYNWQKRRQIYAESKLYVVGPSKWVVDAANESILKAGMVESMVIPNGIDLSIFHLGDKIAAREKLALPKDAFIVIFSASGLKKNQFKDFQTLQHALEILGKSNEKILCIALGDSGESEYIGNSVELRFIPFISDASTVAEYYRAADVYVHPAKADTFPTSVIEAEACGLPVVASKVCGIPEQIEEGKTGFLVSVGDAETMAERILLLKRDVRRCAEMGVYAAELAKERYDDKMMVERYLLLYWSVHSAFEKSLANTTNTVFSQNR